MSSAEALVIHLAAAAGLPPNAVTWAETKQHNPEESPVRSAGTPTPNLFAVAGFSAATTASPAPDARSEAAAGDFTDVIAVVDPEHSWQSLLLPAICAARHETARLHVLALPSAIGTSRLQEVRAELQGHDIRTLPSGLRCSELERPLREQLAEMLQETPRPVVLVRNPAGAAAMAAAELLGTGHFAGNSAAEPYSALLLCFADQ
ncbi:MAG: hypothetical protein RLZZ436_2711 [Planctomycetota bacterium]|jgi:hypothetical protein